MTTLRTAAQQALEALEAMIEKGRTPPTSIAFERAKARAAALRAALAEPVQEFASIPGTNVRVRLPVQEPAPMPPFPPCRSNGSEAAPCVASVRTGRRTAMPARARTAQQELPVEVPHE